MRVGLIIPNQFNMFDFVFQCIKKTLIGCKHETALSFGKCEIGAIICRPFIELHKLEG